MILEKYSMGTGDRFGRQGKAQLDAFLQAKDRGIHIAPVWNKSHREHIIIGSAPIDVLKEAKDAVQDLGWEDSYYVDADHIQMTNVDLFIPSSNYFTIDIANFIGRTPDEEDVRAFVEKFAGYKGRIEIPGMEDPLEISRDDAAGVAGKFLAAVREAGRIYRHIEEKKGVENFITEISMDETGAPQSPLDLFFILASIADEGIPVQAIAPKFSGRFNKGVDYEGNIEIFAREFEQDLAIIAWAAKEFGLPQNLKPSIHSGSDKFSIYGAMNRAIRKYDAGLHIKTAGTTWIEELIGLALAGGKGLEIAKEIYQEAFSRLDELCTPYRSVIDIDEKGLPDPGIVEKWKGEEFARALRHDRSCDRYNPHFRQLLHVGYKIAAEMRGRYLEALDEFEDIISPQVTENILERHMKPIFLQR